MNSKVQTGTPHPLSEPPPSGQAPPRALAVREVKARAAELVAYHAPFHDLFGRREQRPWSELYLRGQLWALECKTVEPMVLALRDAHWAAVRAMEQFLGQGA